MGCFTFSDGEKRSEPNTVTVVSHLSSSSALGEDDVNRSGSDFNSQDISDTSAESMRKNSFFSMSQRSTCNLRVFTFQELKTATKGFGRSVRLGEGGFGCVYKGLIKSTEDPSTKIDVAIKQLGKRGLQGHKEWVTEVNFLGVVEHPNLVKLVGYCADDDERGIQRLLIYEYMPNGSVEDHLSPRSRTILPWAMRLRIARDAARGLAYLHEEMDFQIIFRDFKSSNILLDEQWNAKLSDFGLARLGPPEGLTHVSTALTVPYDPRLIYRMGVLIPWNPNHEELRGPRIVGTMGYAAPEYIRTGRLTSKNDVWSYGIFLYELITGRRPIDKNRPKSEQRLIEWVRPYLSDIKKFEHIVDPRLGKSYPLKSIHKLSVIANRCLVRQPKSRPKMSDVLEMINNLVGASTELGVPLPIMSTEREETTEVKNGKRRAASAKSTDNNWLTRFWRPALWKIR